MVSDFQDQFVVNWLFKSKHDIRQNGEIGENSKVNIKVIFISMNFFLFVFSRNPSFKQKVFSSHDANVFEIKLPRSYPLQPVANDLHNSFKFSKN